jgi:hypothetical protein
VLSLTLDVLNAHVAFQSFTCLRIHLVFFFPLRVFCVLLGGVL